MLTGGGTTITYASFNLPNQITRSNWAAAFTYGPEHQRLSQAVTGPTPSITTYVDPDGKGAPFVEKESLGGGTVQWNNYLYAAGAMVGVVFERTTSPDPTVVYTRYFHKDHLGSTAVITDEAGLVLERLSYDTWGKRRYPNGAYDSQSTITSQTDRGFTGHEHLHEVNLIHMNGRIYDPRIGRFLTADPVIDGVFSTQGMNRYSYVGNNPLAYTDPDGLFLKGVFRAIGNILSNPRALIAIAAAVAIGHPELALANAIGSTAAAAVGGAVAGGIMGGDMKSVVLGAVTGGAFGVIGGANWTIVEKAAAMAVVGGVSSQVAGGNFVSGFLTAGVTGLVGPMLPDFGTVGNILKYAVLGGTAAVIGGGKFENGAISYAFAYAVGQLISSPGIGTPGTSPEQTSGRTAFVGGFFDRWTDGPTWQQFRRTQDAVYFTWDQSRDLAAWINSHGGDVTVHAHSWGADTAARVVAQGQRVANLITYDPVSFFRPDFAAVAANAGTWVNLNATGGQGSFANFIAGIGGAWNNAPTSYATYHRSVPTDHARIVGQCYGAPRSCGGSLP